VNTDVQRSKLQEPKRASLKMADQLQNVDFQNAIMTLDHLKRSTNLPLFHTNESMDTMTGIQFNEGVKIATNIETWDDK